MVGGDWVLCVWGGVEAPEAVKGGDGVVGGGGGGMGRVQDAIFLLVDRRFVLEALLVGSDVVLGCRHC